jgi:hypothetical protein
MSNTPKLPQELFKACDVVIENLYKGQKPPKNIELIHKWLKNDGWDALTGSTANETMAVDFNQLAFTSFSDEEYIAGWLGEEPLTDEMRVAHARMLIANAGKGDDGYLCPSIFGVDIQSTDGRAGVIACVMHIMGQAGPEVSWWGVFKTYSDFLVDLKKAGLVPVEFIPMLTDTEILSYWKKTKKKKKN